MFWAATVPVHLQSCIAAHHHQSDWALHAWHCQAFGRLDALLDPPSLACESDAALTALPTAMHHA